MAYAPTSEPIPPAASASIINRTNKEEIGSRVIRNEKDWKWGKQVSFCCDYCIHASITEARMTNCADKELKEICATRKK